MGDDFVENGDGCMSYWFEYIVVCMVYWCKGFGVCMFSYNVDFVMIDLKVMMGLVLFFCNWFNLLFVWDCDYGG